MGTEWKLWRCWALEKHTCREGWGEVDAGTGLARGERTGLGVVRGIVGRAGGREETYRMMWRAR